MADFVFIQGKVAWVKAVDPNKFGDWSFQIHPDNKSLEMIRDWQSQGLKNILKKDDDGYFITFKRPPYITRMGKRVPLNPPKIIDKDGNPLPGLTIGNGSDATVKLEVYRHKTPSGGKALAARWDSMRIDNLVEFNRDRDFPQEEKEQIAGLVEQPEQIF